MRNFKKVGRRLIPFLPFVILAVAILVAIYHIKIYWH